MIVRFSWLINSSSDTSSPEQFCKRFCLNLVSFLKLMNFHYHLSSMQSFKEIMKRNCVPERVPLFWGTERERVPEIPEIKGMKLRSIPRSFSVICLWQSRKCQPRIIKKDYFSRKFHVHFSYADGMIMEPFKRFWLRKLVH